jgi:hypothetical protein
MAQPSWQISGDYLETCSCDFVCPCITGNLAAPPTRGYCHFALLFHIERGQFQGLPLDGLSFVVIGHAPEQMDRGNWAVGLITDDRATPQQQQALVAIATGQAGGPMAALAGLIGQFQGVEARPIHYQRNGLQRSVSVPGLLDQALAGVPGANPNEPIVLDNTGHPANTRLALAHAVRSHVHAFGIDWDQTDGRNNGHFAPFAWQGS